MNRDLKNSSKTISNKERQTIAEKFTIKVGHEGNIKYNIIDLAKYAEHVMKERENLKVPPFVSIKPIYVNKIKSERKSMTFVKDRTFDVYYGRFRGFDKHGNMNWNRIDIDNSLELDLRNIVDVQLWIIVRMHPSIQGSPFEDHATYKIADPMEDAMSENEKAKGLIEAYNRVNLLKGKELVFFSRFLGIEIPEGSNSDIVKGLLNKNAYENPIQFNNMFVTKDRGIKELVNSGIVLSIIKETKEGYKFEGLSLGLLRDDVYEFFKQNGQYISVLTEKILEEDKVCMEIENEKEENIKKAAKKLNE